MLPDILKDVNSGHNIVTTVFIECGAMYNPENSITKNVISETEFVNGIAAMSDSGLYGKTKIAAGIVGSAPLLIGKKVASGRGLTKGSLLKEEAVSYTHLTLPTILLV